MHAVKDNLGKRAARKRKTSAIRGPRRSHLGGSRLQCQGAGALNLWPCPAGHREEGPSWEAAAEAEERPAECEGLRLDQMGAPQRWAGAGPPRLCRTPQHSINPTRRGPLKASAGLFICATQCWHGAETWLRGWVDREGQSED